MTYQVLARKWRPKVFGEVIGQEHVTRTLQNSVKQNQVAHAYLLTGTRGVGKTTIARIFAKSIRCENLKDNGDPCLKCSSCLSIDDSSSLDYIEIDGASNTGVDNIRELIENVQYLPTSGSRKVYVIDEVHMLTVNAFNALLKTLEEPPAHVVFIFATTDPQKLLGTVLSRCQRFDFKTVALDTLVAHIKKIAQKEEIKFESDTLMRELAKQGKGSVRDTLSLLDQVLSLSTSKNITEDSLLLSLGLANTRIISQLISSVLVGDKDKCTELFNSALEENVDLSKFSLQILDQIFDVIEKIDSKNTILESGINSEVFENITTAELLWVYETLAKDFQWALTSMEPEKVLLFTLVKVSLRAEIFAKEANTLVVKKKVSENLIEEQTQQTQQIIIQESETTSAAIPEVLEDVIEVKLPEGPKSWDGFLSFIKDSSKSIGANLERGNILSDNVTEESLLIEIGFSEDNKIFYDYINEPETRNKIKEELADYYDVYSENIELTFSLLDKKTKEQKNFMSKVEIEEEQFNQIQAEKKKNIEENKYIKEAEKIFNTKIDKIVLSEDK